LPSIARLQTREFATNSAMQIDGIFPATQGTVTITNASGTFTPAPVSWTTSAVVVAIPAEGAGSSGLVQVVAGGIASNAVPLTQWHGQLTYSENDALADVGGAPGTGSGLLQTVFTIAVRADVHPTVVTIDQTPQPQNLAFSDVEGDSSAAVTGFSGTFHGNVSGSASFALVAAPPTMAPFNSPASMGVHSVPSQPAPCNNAQQGPQGGAGSVFCPGLSFFSMNVGTCTGSLCTIQGENSPSGAFGGGLGSGGLLELTLNRVTYGITVSASPGPSFSSNNFGGEQVTGTATVTGTFSAPVSPPSGTTTAARPAR
jgi:hypothetical protein